MSIAARMRIVILSVCLLLPAAAGGQALTSYYCTTASDAAGGTGSATAPWLCPTDEELQAVLNTVCVNGGGTLYRSFSASFLEYVVAPAPDGQCQITVREGPGNPPTAGVALPRPSALNLAAGLGLACLLAGLLLRFSAPRPVAD